MSRVTTVRVGFLLGQGGEFGFVAAAALARGLIEPDQFAPIRLLFAASVALTVPVTVLCERIARRLAAR